MPPGVITVIGELPVPAGAVAVICVADTTVKEAALVLPNSTALALSRLLPVSVTTTPPAVGPWAGPALSRAGGAA